MFRIYVALTLILSACGPSASPPTQPTVKPAGGCLNFCSSNAECKGFGGECVFCNSGRCLQHPIDPFIGPPDAGVSMPGDH
jgi:hypothetical protein